MAKHRVFSINVYPGPEYFTQPLVAMVVKFCMSDKRSYILHDGTTFLLTDSQLPIIIES